MHTQGGTPKRWFVATAGVMLFKGPQARRCTHKAEHPKGGLWPPQGSCYLRGHRQGGAHTRRNKQKAVCGCPHKAEHTKGGLWPPQESCYLRGHRQGGAHKAEHPKGGLQAPTVPKKILARCGMLRHASSCWSRVPSFSESSTGFKNL